MGEEDDADINDIRRCQVAFHTENEDTQWIFQRLDMVLTQINNEFYNFDLNGYEAIQYTRYSAEDSGTYNWHMDMSMGSKFLPKNETEPRKLSMTLLLNDKFTGGEFRVNSGREEHSEIVPCPRGRAIIFPLFCDPQGRPAPIWRA